MAKPLFINSIDASVDHVLDTIPGDIVLGIPLGVGKPNPFVNALYRRIKANPARKLRIVTALSLKSPWAIAIWSGISGATGGACVWRLP